MSHKQLIGIARIAHAAPELQRKNFATYSQLASFKLLNRCDSRRVPFDWTINPYRGCEFGCVYCYARYTHEFMFGLARSLAPAAAVMTDNRSFVSSYFCVDPKLAPLTPGY